MEYCSRTLVMLFVLLIADLVVAAESKEAKIKRALSAAPSNVARDARIVDMDQQGNMTVLRDGHNGFTCVAGHVGVVGDGPACVDAAAMQWILDWMAHRPKPTNAAARHYVPTGWQQRLECYRSMGDWRNSSQVGAWMGAHLAI